MFTIKPQKDVEEQVLSSCLNDLDAVFYTLDHLKTNDFHLEKNMRLYQHLIQAAFDLNESRDSDIITYLQTKIGKEDYTIPEILGIVSKLPSGANVGYFVDQLKNYSLLRKFHSLLRRTQSHAQEGEYDFQKLVSSFETEYLSLIDVDSPNLDMASLAEETFEGIIETKDKKLSGYSWGLNELDTTTGGIERSKSYVIGGLKKSGKTKLLINTQANLLKNNVRCGWISLEMNAKNLMRWILSRIAHVDSDKIRKGFISNEEIERLRTVTDWLRINHKLIHIDDRPALETIQVRGLIRKWAKLGVGVVFLDYLQRLHIDTSRGDNRATAIQRATVELADIAKEYNVALVYLSQLRNEAEGRMAGIGDLKESGGIGESVDCAIILNNLDRINKMKTKQNKSKLVIEQRDGASDEIELSTRLKYSEYLNYCATEETPQYCDEVDLPFELVDKL